MVLLRPEPIDAIAKRVQEESWAAQIGYAVNNMVRLSIQRTDLQFQIRDGVISVDYADQIDPSAVRVGTRMLELTADQYEAATRLGAAIPVRPALENRS